MSQEWDRRTGNRHLDYNFWGIILEIQNSSLVQKSGHHRRLARHRLLLSWFSGKTDSFVAVIFLGFIFGDIRIER